MAVEPPSPSDSSRKFDFPDEQTGRDLQRTKTVPTRRSRSSSDVGDGPNNERQHRRRRPSPAPPAPDADDDQTRRASSKNHHHHRGGGDLLNPASLEAEGEDGGGGVDNEEEDAGNDDVPRSSCRVYRVRSFTTKKGGSVVNRGDSIKICGGGGAGSRRGSQLLITPTNDADLLGGGLQAASSSSSLRRRSVNCLTSGSRLQPEVVGLGVGGVGSHSRRHSFIIRPSSAGRDAGGGGVGRRTSLRGNERPTATDRGGGVSYRVELTLGANNLRRPSADRLNTDALDHTAVGSAATAADESLPNDVDADINDGVADDEDEDDDEVQVYKVMVLGSHGVGKTTLVQQLLTSEYLANVDDEQGQSISLASQCHAVSSRQRTRSPAVARIADRTACGDIGAPIF